MISTLKTDGSIRRLIKGLNPFYIRSMISTTRKGSNLDDPSYGLNPFYIRSMISTFYIQPIEAFTT
uniref:Uncharacterized protein n=1 Tax=Kuenenia stuttgartiensis TaxID=174633 RepID=Q1Q3I3_KUEST|nr:unknown protein [Candidatus Kuenenia stuttgartiensis]